jgi:uncharacterized protein DUF3800
MPSARDILEMSRAFLADKEGVIAVLKVFMDESGTHDTSPVVTVAAYMGRPTAWRDWTSKWARVLRPIKVYHAVDAQHLKGEFEGWTSAEVGELVAKLLPITANAAIGAVAASIDLRVFEKAISGRDDLKELFGNPYIACLQNVMHVLMAIVANAGTGERIAFIHENNGYHQEAYDCFDWVKKNCNYGGNVVSLSFGAKGDYPPLQAADILAYETNKRVRDISRPARRPWKSLRADKFAMTYDKGNMDELVKVLDDIKRGRDLGVTPMAAWGRVFAPKQLP